MAQGCLIVHVLILLFLLLVGCLLAASLLHRDMLVVLTRLGVQWWGPVCWEDPLVEWNLVLLSVLKVNDAVLNVRVKVSFAAHSSLLVDAGDRTSDGHGVKWLTVDASDEAICCFLPHRIVSCDHKVVVHVLINLFLGRLFLLSIADDMEASSLTLLDNLILLAEIDSITSRPFLAEGVWVWDRVTHRLPVRLILVDCGTQHDTWGAWALWSWLLHVVLLIDGLRIHIILWMIIIIYFKFK